MLNCRRTQLSFWGHLRQLLVLLKFRKVYLDNLCGFSSSKMHSQNFAIGGIDHHLGKCLAALAFRQGTLHWPAFLVFVNMPFFNPKVGGHLEFHFYQRKLEES